MAAGGGTFAYPAVFLKAFQAVLSHEGLSVSRLKGDPGGVTKFGICSKEYPDLDIAGLTVDDARAIYWRDWWEKFGFAKLPESIAPKVFDLAVCTGAHEAFICLQRAMRAEGYATAESDGWRRCARRWPRKSNRRRKSP